MARAFCWRVNSGLRISRRRSSLSAMMPLRPRKSWATESSSFLSSASSRSAKAYRPARPLKLVSSTAKPGSP